LAVTLEKKPDAMQGQLNFERHAAIDELHNDAGERERLSAFVACQMAVVS
jgi:hypothetical protein